MNERAKTATSTTSAPRLGDVLLAWCRLVRLPNIFSAAADILLGYWITFQSDWQSGALSLPLLVGSSCMLYGAGMVTNDLFDLRIDEKERPFRPLPSGAVSRNSAIILSMFLVTFGLFAADTVGVAAGLFALAIAIVMLSYNARAKHYAFGPFVMGACRGLNVLLGMSVAIGAGVVSEPLWLIPLGNSIYIAGVTWFAKQEAERSSRARLGTGASLMGLGLLTHSIAMFLSADQVHPAAWPAGIAFIAFIGPQVYRAFNEPDPASVQRAVKSTVLGLILLDAVLVTAFAGPLWGAVVAALLIPALLLGKWIYST